jgi:hypothetical protein
MQLFALEAVNAIRDCEEVAIFACTNTRFTRRPVKHGAYYALNLLAVVNPWSKLVPLDRLTKRIERRVEFESGYEGAWQTLPPEVIEALSGYDIVFKAGMGLLRVPSPEILPPPILSFHHGDPDKYRGRPAGFWEMAEGEPMMGQIVQMISNKLDAGRIVAFAETRVMPWSYRSTLIESYRHSPLIINEAVRNALAEHYLPKPCQGKNYRLPSNVQVAGSALRMAAQFVRRLFYGAFFEKRWKVSLADAPSGSLAALTAAFPPRPAWRTLDEAKGYTLYADPFFCREGLLVEALKAGSGLGEIVLVRGDTHQRVSPAGGHMSYPLTIDVGEGERIIPEMANWSTPKVFALEGGRMHETAELKIEGAPRVVDPTLIEHGGRIYLFGNVKAVGSNVLFLWSADRLEGLFRLHPLSPIRVSPRGARMGGCIVEQDGRLYRIGQDFRSDYGDGLAVFEIETLTGEDYREREVGALRFSGVKGPHTLNLKDGQLLFDWYRDRFSPLAGVRRLAARLSTSRSRPSRSEAPPARAPDPRT